MTVGTDPTRSARDSIPLVQAADHIARPTTRSADIHRLEVNVGRNREEAINSYVTDMLSLEEHIEKALRGQLEDLEDYPEVTRDLKQVLRKVEHHISDPQRA